MMDLPLVEDEVLKKNIIEMFSIHKHLWNERLGTTETTNRTNDLKEGTNFILQQCYCSGRLSRQMLRVHIDKYLEAGVIDPALLELAIPILLVP